MPPRQTMRVQDMTQGSPLRLILIFAVPLLIGNIFQQIYTVVDTMVVGHNLGDPAIAAIGATSSLYNFLINLAIGLNSGYGIVVTQRFGARDEKSLKQSIAGMLILNVGVTALLTVLTLVFLRPLLRFMNTPDSIFEQTYLYIAVIGGGMLATVCYNMFAAILRAVGNSRSPLYFLIISCFLNIGLDLLLVMVFHAGVAGAAAATVAAQAISAALCGGYVWKHYRAILPGRADFRLPGELVSELASAGFAMALMYCVVDIGSMIFQRANNALGDFFITAHTAGRRIVTITMQPIGAITTANSTFVGQNFGAKKLDRIRTTLKRVIGVQVSWGICICVVVVLLGAPLVRITTGTSDPELIRNAVLSIRLHLSCYPALAVLLCLRTSMQAMGHKVAPILSSCVELAMKIFSALWLIPQLGFLGTCLTEPVTWILMMVFLVAAYLIRRDRLFAPDVPELTEEGRV